MPLLLVLLGSRFGASAKAKLMLDVAASAVWPGRACRNQPIQARTSVTVCRSFPFALMPNPWICSWSTACAISCALTQNAVLRILGHPRYPNSPGAPAAVAILLQQLMCHPRHQLWADTYLPALAVRQAARLASFDRRLVTCVVAGGTEALELISA